MSYCSLTQSTQFSNDLKRAALVGVVLAAAFLLSVRNAIKMLCGADENGPVGDGWRGVNRFVERVGSDHFMLRSSFDHENVAVFTAQQNVVFIGHWRSRECSGFGGAATFVF